MCLFCLGTESQKLKKNCQSQGICVYITGLRQAYEQWDILNVGIVVLRATLSNWYSTYDGINRIIPLKNMNKMVLMVLVLLSIAMEDGKE